MKKHKFSSWPSYSKLELKAVSKVLSSGKVNYLYGQYGKIFEKNFARYINTKYSIAISNGTVALELALLSLSLNHNDEVIVTPRSYFSSASSILKVGLKPIFADIDINSQNITLDSIKKLINKKTKVIICVHLAGFPCDMNEISSFARKKKIKIIEDCSQAHGAKIKNKKVGSFGDISVWSFCNDKIISTGGEGGMLTTNHRKYWQFMWSYKDQGKNYQKFFSKKNNNKFKYIHDNIGSNFRITEIQSIIGIIQLQNLDKNIKLRNIYAKLINKTLIKFPSVQTTKIKKYYIHSYYRYYFFINQKYLKKKWNRDKILKKISSYNINCGTGSCPTIYKEKPFRNIFKTHKRKFINAEKLGKSSISLAIHHKLNYKEVILICNILNKVLKEATI